MFTDLQFENNIPKVLKIQVGNFRYPVTFTKRDGKLWASYAFNKKITEELKALDGTTWHGYKDPPIKLWSLADSQHNRFQLDALSGGNPYAWFESPLVDFKPRREEVRAHQIEIAQFELTRHYCVIAAEMGCVSGDAIINCNRARRGFEITLQELYYKFHGGADRGHSWDAAVTTYAKSNKDGILGLNKILNVLYKGQKITLKLKTKLGYEIKVTADHEIFITNNETKIAESLKIGDTILVNGKWLDKDGYYRVGGYKHKHPRWTTGGVYEHILVMERHLGRFLERHEEVHHKNHIRSDNRLENLELHSSHASHMVNHPELLLNLHNGTDTQILVSSDEIVEISDGGLQPVFDIVMESPYHNFVADGVIVHNCGKTLSTIECMEAVKPTSSMWIAPKSAMYSVQLEFDKWKALVRPSFHTYEGLRELAKNWPRDAPPPQMLILDEASRCKTHTAQRTQAAKWMADYIREYWGEKGYVILMSGSPAPKSPVDWHSICNIACPGFLREGSPEKFRYRLAIMKQAEGVGGTYSALESWLDDEKKCKTCGKFAEDYIHDEFNLEEDHHTYAPSKNEVSYLYERMNGLVLVKLKKDCLNLPEKQYREIRVKPSQNIINAAKLLVAQGNSGIKTLTLLRELSDGFQYDQEAVGTESCPLCNGERTAIDFIYIGPDDQYDEMMRRQYEGLEIPEGTFQTGTKACPHCDGTGEVTSYTRTATQVESAKEQVLSDLFDEHDDIGRLVVYAGFTGSVDRCVEIAEKNQWKWIRADGRGWCSNLPGDAKELLARFQSNDEQRIAFIGQPSASGMGITLHKSPSIVFYSNDFNAESRIQAEDRVHRMGMDLNRGCTIIDLIHLPSDELVLNNLKKKKKLQSLTMGDLNNQLNWK